MDAATDYFKLNEIRIYPGKSKLCVMIFLFSLFVAIADNTKAQSPGWLWTNSIGGKNSESARSIVVDPKSGDVYATGVFSGTVDFDPSEEVSTLSSVGSSAIFITKFDHSGHLAWARAISSQDVAYAMSIALDHRNGDIVITGSFHGTIDFDPGLDIFNLTSAGTSDLFIAHLDASGNFIWAKGFGGPDAVYVLSIAIDPSGSGDIYTTGHFRGTVDFDPGAEQFNLISVRSDDVFILKLDGNGNFVWAKSFGGPGSDVSRCITLSGNGDIYTTGWFSETVDFDPGPNSHNITSIGHFDIFISKIDRLGNLIWAKQLGGTGDKDGAGSSIVVEPKSGDIYVTGYFEGTADFDPEKGFFYLSSAGLRDIFISKLNSAGNFQWAKSIGGDGLDVGGYLAVDPTGSGDIYTTGYFEGTVDFDPGPGSFHLNSIGCNDIFISKFDDTGNFEWAKAISGSKEETANSIAIDASGSAYVTGLFNGPNISFDSRILLNAEPEKGTSDLFIAKLGAMTSSSNKVGAKKTKIDIYPNPVKDRLYIKLPDEKLSNITLSIFNLKGEMVFSKTVEPGYKELSIDISELPPALYMAELILKEDKLVKPIVKAQE